MSKPRLYAKTPDGKLVSRLTYRKYTHAILVPCEDTYRGGEGWCALAWTSVPDKMLPYWRARFSRAALAEVLP
jgi:hypothetical protein